MKLNYITKIKANISIYTKRKTSNLLEGTYKSIYKGKSLNFENLREYVINDDIKDIDWKASARSGTLLVKQFVAEKKHNIMIAIDTGTKMDGDTSSLEPKKNIALFVAGTLGYIAIHNGDYIGMIYNREDKIENKRFKYNLTSLEQYLTEYEKDATIENKEGLSKTLDHLLKHSNKKMILFIITDLLGMNQIEINTLKKLTMVHDTLLINISDASISENSAFDLENKEYIPALITNNPELAQIEKQVKKDLLNKMEKKFKQTNTTIISISKLEEITPKIIELLERHRYASNN